MTKNFEPGFYENVAFSDYLASSAINNSGLKLFGQSPAKFRFWQNNDKPGTPAQVEGSALHTLILEGPETFTGQYGKGPAPRVGSAGRTKWDKANPTATPLTPGQWDNVHGMSEAFEHTSCSLAKELLSGGISELSIWFDDPGTDLRSKIRIDYLKNDNIIVDVKSSQSGSPQGFLREVKRWGYDRQVAFYERGLNAAYAFAEVSRRMEAFVFVVIENFPPFEVAIYVLSQTLIDEANRQIDEDLKKYKECLESNAWPSYPNKIIILGENSG